VRGEQDEKTPLEGIFAAGEVQSSQPTAEKLTQQEQGLRELQEGLHRDKRKLRPVGKPSPKNKSMQLWKRMQN